MTASASATPDGAPIWVDLGSSDVPASMEFYSALLGWKFEEPNQDFGGYTNAFLDGRRVAGLGPTMAPPGQPAPPDAWTVYLASHDINATVADVMAAGGTTFAAPMQIGELGFMALTANATGAALGLWQPGTHTGTPRTGVAGTPSWHELNTRNFKAATAFYSQVFGTGWTPISDTDDFRYTQMNIAGENCAGMMDVSRFLPDGVPSHWSVYFAVENLDASLARAVELGASVTQDADDSPWGRLAALTDPTGAAVKLHQLPVSGS